MNCGIRNAERGIEQPLTRWARRFRLCQPFSDLEVPRLRLRRTRATPGNVSLLTEVSSPRPALRFRASDGALGPKGRGNLAQALAWVAYFVGARSEGPSEARTLRAVRARDRNFCWGTMASFIAVLETSHAQTHKTQANAWVPVGFWSQFRYGAMKRRESAENIIPWAVRPRECEIKASSAEGAAEMVALCREQCRQISLTPNRLARHLSGGSQNPPRLQRWTARGPFPWA